MWIKSSFASAIKRKSTWRSQMVITKLVFPHSVPAPCPALNPDSRARCARAYVQFVPDRSTPRSLAAWIGSASHVLPDQQATR